MKKFTLIFLAIFTILTNSAQASEVDFYCPKEPYNISKGIGSFLTSITGANLLTTQVVEKEMEKALNRELNSKFTVKIKTFGGNNLINGKFKNLQASSKSLKRNGVYFSSLKAETLCNFNHIKYKDNQLYFVENLLIGYQGKITQDDLKKTINTDEYQNAVNKLSVSANGSLFAKITNLDIAINNNKIIMSYDVLVPLILGSLPKHIEFSASLEVENGKIKFANIDFGNKFTNKTMQSVIPLINKLNPLTYQIKTDKKNNAIINVKNIKIINNEIITNGIIILPKNYNVK